MKKVIKYGISVFLLLFISSFILTTFLIQKKIIRQKHMTKASIIFTDPTISKKDFLIKGSIPYWDQEKARTSFQKNVSSFNYINVFWYYMGEDGAVVKYKYAEEDRGLISFAHENGVKVSAVITNLLEEPEIWSSRRVEDVIGSEQKKLIHINNIVKKLKDYNFDGVIIDYELLRPSTRNDYSAFVQDLSLALNKENKALTVVLHPRTGSDVKGEEISKFQDWEVLAGSADQLQIMGYSEHSDEDEPGPVAGTKWVKQIIDYAKSLEIPAEKLFLGIPLYGYDWNKENNSPATGLTFEDISGLISKKNPRIVWDEENASPRLEYGSHEVWFENARSVREKAELARKSGFAGVTFWRLGGEDPKVWEELKNF